MKDAVAPLERRRIWRGRLLLLLIIGLPAVPITLAWLSYRTGVGVPEQRRNLGILVQPPMSLAALLPPPVASKPQWTLLLSGARHCEDDCRQLLQRTRQMHIALGRRAWRLRRIYLYQGAQLPPGEGEFLANEHPGLTALPLNSTLSERLDKARARATDLSGVAEVFLVDPRGFVILAYGTEHRGKEALQDLRFLMRIDAGSGGG